MYQIIKLNDDLEWVPVNKATFDEYEEARVSLNELKRIVHDPMNIHEIGKELPDG